MRHSVHFFTLFVLVTTTSLAAPKRCSDLAQGRLFGEAGDVVLDPTFSPGSTAGVDDQQLMGGAPTPESIRKVGVGLVQVAYGYFPDAGIEPIDGVGMMRYGIDGLSGAQGYLGLINGISSRLGLGTYDSEQTFFEEV